MVKNNNNSNNLHSFLTKDVNLAFKMSATFFFFCNQESNIWGEKCQNMLVLVSSYIHRAR